MPRDDQQDLSVHVDDQLLAALALGETDDLGDLSPAEVGRARQHLASCARCAEDLSALQEAFAVATAAPAEQLTAPPPSVWAAISAQIAAESAPAAATPPAAAPPAATSPAGPPPPAQATDRPLAAPVDLASRRRGVPTWLASTAAAITLVAGLGGGWLIASQSDDPDQAPQATVVGTAQLASLDASAADRGRAEVRRRGDEVVLSVQASQLDGPQGIREVWLINLDGKRMVSLGLLARGEAGEFEFPAELLDEGYQIVDISYEPSDGDPTHSGQSLARGALDV